MSRRILISGATGKQGGATLRALQASASTPSPFSYIAMTRDPASSGAQRLKASLPNVSIVRGELSDLVAAFKELKQDPPWGFFLVTPVGAKEEALGKAAVDAAVQAGVKHFVFTSVERRDNGLPTEVPHFASKHNIEQYLKAKAEESGMTWTILRPVCFMDNLTDSESIEFWSRLCFSYSRPELTLVIIADFLGKAFSTMYRQLGNNPLQLVASSDIGFWGAKGFLEADGWGRNREVSIAGDELTYAQAAKVFEEKVGRPMPVTFGLVGSMIKTVSHEMGSMFKWFADVGWNVDVQASRRENSALMDFGTWLEKESQFKVEIERRGQ